MITVIFVCLGNICRSPMAEAVFQRLVDEAGLSEHFRIESRGTGAWHVGEPAHSGTRRVLAAHGIAYVGRAEQIGRPDVADSQTYLIAMDAENMATLRQRFGAHPRLYRLLDFAPHLSERDVPDPYDTGGFEQVYELVAAGCRGLLAAIRAGNERLERLKSAPRP